MIFKYFDNFSLDEPLKSSSLTFEELPNLRLYILVYDANHLTGLLEVKKLLPDFLEWMRTVKQLIT